LRVIAQTVAAAVCGSLAFVALRLPAPELSGAMVGVACLLAFKQPVSAPNLLRDAGMLISGAVMGGSVTPEMLQGFQRYPVSLLLFFVSICATVLITSFYLQRAARWDRATAFFASVPGALSTVTVVADAAKADALKVSMVQSLRLFVLVALVPSLALFGGGAGAVVSSPGLATPASILFQLGLGAILSFAMSRVGVAAPWLFGGMLVSAIAHASGLVSGGFPVWLSAIGFCLVGLFIGTRFHNIDGAALRDHVVHAVVAFLIALGVCIVMAGTAAGLSGVNFAAALVAFAPGGLEAMIVLGASLGLDPIYVGVHHITRFLGIGFLLPVVASTFIGKGD
jgi:uncharacterized protein